MWRGECEAGRAEAAAGSGPVRAGAAPACLRAALASWMRCKPAALTDDEAPGLPRGERPRPFSRGGSMDRLTPVVTALTATTSEGIAALEVVVAGIELGRGGCRVVCTGGSWTGAMVTRAASTAAALREELDVDTCSPDDALPVSIATLGRAPST